jgi:hypothetical protein
MAKKERSTVVQSLLDSGGSTTINVLLSNATIYTDAFRLGDASLACIQSEMGMAATGGSGKMTVTVEQSHERPTAEYSAHNSYVASDYIMRTFSATTTSYTHGAITIRGMEWGRCKIVAVTPNTSAYIKLTLSKQVEG